MQGKSQIGSSRVAENVPLSEALAALKLVREFNCTHAPALMHLPHFKNMDAAVFGVLKANSVSEDRS